MFVIHTCSVLSVQHPTRKECFGEKIPGLDMKESDACVDCHTDTAGMFPHNTLCAKYIELIA
jgi:hypothetical protein